MNIIEEKWDSVVDTLSTEFGFSPISINTWIKPLQVQRYDSDEGTLFIYVPIDEMGINEDFINSYINKKFTTPLRSTIAELTGLDCTKIVYTVEQNVVKEADSSSNTDNSFNNILEKANLNPEYTFENFVVGSNNKFAHAASLAVAESPGEIYNPLFLYGGVGLGKTHLMHSIAHFILENNPQTRVLYVTSESFTNELIEAIRNGNLALVTDRVGEVKYSVDRLRALFAQETKRQREYEVVALITIATRAAVSGGLDVDTAFSMSDLYLQRIDKHKTFRELEEIARHAIRSFCEKVAECKDKELGKYSPRIQKAIKYIRTHLHYPISLAEVASSYTTLFRSRKSVRNIFPPIFLRKREKNSAILYGSNGFGKPACYYAPLKCRV